MTQHFTLTNSFQPLSTVPSLPTSPLLLTAHLFNNAIALLIIACAIRMGELEPWMDETFIRQVWYNLGEQVVVKLIRDKVTGYVVSFPIVGMVGTYIARLPAEAQGKI
jgi:hypothetical protein